MSHQLNKDNGLADTNEQGRFMMKGIQHTETRQGRVILPAAQVPWMTHV